MDTKKIYYDKEIRSAVGVFEGFMSFENFKELAIQVNELRSKNFSKKQLNNVKDMKVLTQEVQKWIKEFWFPKAQASGLKHMAFVVPENTFAKMSMEAVNSNADQIEIRYFGNLTEAKNWLAAK